jgi:hypothetical protein
MIPKKLPESDLTDHEMQTQWINDCRDFQILTGSEPTPITEMEKEWALFTKKQRKFEANSIATHLIIYRLASKNVIYK